MDGIFLFILKIKKVKKKDRKIVQYLEKNVILRTENFNTPFYRKAN